MYTILKNWNPFLKKYHIYLLHCCSCLGTIILLLQKVRLFIYLGSGKRLDCELRKSVALRGGREPEVGSSRGELGFSGESGFIQYIPHSTHPKKKCRDIVDSSKYKHQSVLIIRIPKPSGTRPDPEKNSQPDPTFSGSRTPLVALQHLESPTMKYSNTEFSTALIGTSYQRPQLASKDSTALV